MKQRFSPRGCEDGVVRMGGGGPLMGAAAIVLAMLEGLAGAFTPSTSTGCARGDLLAAPVGDF